MADGIIGSVGVTVTSDATNFWRDFEAHTRPGAVGAGRNLGRGVREGMQSELDRGINIRIRADTAAARAEIARLEAEIARLRAEADRTSTRIVRGNQQAAKSFNLLMDGALLLGPALIPIAGAAVALGAAFVGAGVAGIAAFKGIQAEMKAGTALGKQYTSSLAQLKTAAAGVEHSAAQGFAISFDQIRDKILRAAPQLSAELGRMSKETGRIASHLTGALISGFTTFAPLMQHVLYYVDQLAARFEKWAAGPAGAKFASVLRQDFEKVMPALASLGELVGKIIASLHNYGLGVVSVFGTIAATLNKLPLPVLTALITGIIGLRAAAFAALAVEKLVIATRGLGLAAGLGANGLAVLGRTAGLWVAGIVAAGFATNVAENATKGWAKSSNGLARGLHEAAASFHDVLTLKWGSIGSEMTKGEDAYKRFATSLKQVSVAQHAIAAQSAALHRQLSIPLPGVRGQTVTPGPDLAAFNTNRAKAFADIVAGVTQKITQMGVALRTVAVSGAGDVFQKTQAGIQKTVDSVDAFLKIGGKTVTTIDGIKISEGAWRAAMDATGQSGAALVGTIQGMIEGMHRGRGEINKLIDEQIRLNKYQSDAESKFGLTAAQVDTYSTALGLTIPKITASNEAEARAEKILGAVSKALANGNEAMQGWLTAVDAAGKGADTLSSRADLLAAGLTALRSANLTAVDNVAQLAKTIDTNSASIGVNGQLLGQLTKTAHGYAVTQPTLTAGSLAISASMQQAGDSAVSLAKSIYANTGNANNAFVAFQGLRQQFIATATQSGLTATQAENLARQIFGIPKDAKTFVKLLGKDDVAAAIRDLTKKLGDFSGIIARALIVVNADTSGANAALNATINLANHAAAAANFAIVPRNVRKEGAVVDYYANGGINKFADGAHVAQIAPAGAMRLWAEPETGGEAYIPLAMSKRARSQRIMAEVASRFGDGYQPKRYADGGTNAAPGKAPPPMKVYVQNPFTGEYLLAQVADVAAGQVHHALGDLTTASSY
jgi:hypothetical protein